MIIVKSKEDGETYTFANVKEVLEEINRDRSNEWTDYNKHDWKEGLEVFTEYELVKVTKGRKQK